MRRLALLIFVLAAGFGPLPAAAVDVERVTSPGGITAWLVRDHRNPIINLRFAFRGGTALDPKGKEGLANLTSTVLDEGAGDMDSKTFQQTLGDKAIELGFDAGRDSFGGHLRTLTKNRDLAFRMLAMAITEPRIDADPLERMRAQILIGLKQDKEDPDTIASERLMQALFPNHAYGRLADGTEESVKAITADDIRGFVKRRFARDNLIVGVVGDIEPEMLKTLLDKTFAKLPAKAEPWQLQEVMPETTGRILVVEKNVPQSKVVFADQGLKRDDPDFYIAYVMNRILGGGGFTSRLYAEVREKRGLAYSVHTSLYPFDASALILGGAGTANARVGETVDVIRHEWTRMAAEGVTEKELEDAKTYLTGAWPLRFSSSGRIARMLVGMQISDLGIDYLDKRNAYIGAVSLDDVKRVAAQYLRPGALDIVVVGKPAGIVPSP